MISLSGRAGKRGVTRYQCPSVSPTTANPIASVPNSKLRKISPIPQTGSRSITDVSNKTPTARTASAAPDQRAGRSWSRYSRPTCSALPTVNTTISTTIASRGPSSRRYPSTMSPSSANATQVASASTTGTITVVAFTKPRVTSPRISTAAMTISPPIPSSARIRKSV